MNYKKIYNSLIESRKINFSEELGEMHHIVPKCLGGDDNVDNLEKLTLESIYWHIDYYLKFIQVIPD